MARLEIVRPQQVRSVLFLDKLSARPNNNVGQDQLIESTVRFDLEEEVRRRTVTPSRRRLRVATSSILLEVAREPIGQHVVLLGPFLCHERLKCLPEEHLVSTRASTHKVEKEICSRH